MATWIVDGPTTDEQKLAAFDQWLGFNTTEDAIVPAIEYYLNEHHDEIEQEIQNQELTLENVDHVKLYKLGKERPVTAHKPVIKKKAKER